MKAEKPKGQSNLSLIRSSKIINLSVNERVINLNSNLTKAQIRGEKILMNLNQLAVNRRCERPRLFSGNPNAIPKEAAPKIDVNTNWTG